MAFEATRKEQYFVLYAYEQLCPEFPRVKFRPPRIEKLHDVVNKRKHGLFCSKLKNTNYNSFSSENSTLNHWTLKILFWIMRSKTSGQSCTALWSWYLKNARKVRLNVAWKQKEAFPSKLPLTTCFDPRNLVKSDRKLENYLLCFMNPSKQVAQRC